MKIKRKYIIIISLIFVISLFIGKVTAISVSSFVLNENGIVNENGSLVLGEQSELPIAFSYKYDENQYLIFCVGGSTQSPFSGATYTRTDSWSNHVRAGIGAIIQNSVGSNSKTSAHGSTSKRLYVAQIAIWSYLKEIGAYTENDLNYTVRSIERNCTLNGTRCIEIYNKLLTKARESSLVVKDSFVISTSANSLNFEKNGDYYVSNEIKVSGNYLNTSTITNSITGPNGTIVEGNNTQGFIVKVPVASLEAGTNRVTIKFTAKSNTIYFARRYIYPNAQDLTSTKMDTAIYNANKSVSGEIAVTPKILIQKRDIENETTPLAGAKFKLTKDGNEIGSYETGSRDLVIEPGAYGKYCVTEVKAPEGYVLSNIPQCVILSSTNIEENIKLINKKNYIKIKKIAKIKEKDGTNYKELTGTKIKVCKAEGINLSNLDNCEIAKTVSGEKIQTNIIGESMQPLIYYGIPAGEYYLVEETTPRGYSKANPIKFIVDEEGNIESDNLESRLNIMDKDDFTIVMENKLIRTYISNQDVTTGKELVGATLQILNKDKNQILDDSGKVMYTWISTGKPYIIEGLPAGVYYLKEITAPDGYTKTNQLVEFKVTDNGEDIKVVMKNSPITEVSNTSSLTSVSLIITSVVLLGIGISIISYVVFKKKNI